MSFLNHEAAYRSESLMQAIAAYPITICGAGAIGANLAETLARQGFKSLTVIDQDRVSEENLGTQPYGKLDVGAQKPQALYNRLYRDLGVAINRTAKTLTSANASSLLKSASLVVDAFDNSESRLAVQQACIVLNKPCLHTGMGSGYAEVIWNEAYRVPSSKGEDLCDYPLARNLVMLTATIASEVIVQFVESRNRIPACTTVTLKDLQISRWSPAEFPT